MKLTPNTKIEIDSDKIAKKIIENIINTDYSDCIVSDYPEVDIRILSHFDDTLRDRAQRLIDESVIEGLQRRLAKGEWIFT
jgi:hypothetical protein